MAAGRGLVLPALFTATAGVARAEGDACGGDAPPIAVLWLREGRRADERLAGVEREVARHGLGAAGVVELDPRDEGRTAPLGDLGGRRSVASADDVVRSAPEVVSMVSRGVQ
ncbi:hypothetical protein WME95_26725 [Sorangium sp. So ce327]|jgi:hypothetical protein|uniref:hypothetical protein n=1 Tax=Sorangium sp. So ce327 TaxID=3133301 RepID=UPI003F648AAD